MDNNSLDPEIYNALNNFSQVSKEDTEKFSKLLDGSSLKCSPLLNSAINSVLEYAVAQFKINMDPEIHKIGLLQSAAWQAAVKALEPAMEEFKNNFLNLEIEANSFIDEETTELAKNELINSINKLSIENEQKEELLNSDSLLPLKKKEPWTRADIITVITLIVTILGLLLDCISTKENVTYNITNNIENQTIDEIQEQHTKELLENQEQQINELKEQYDSLYDLVYKLSSSLPDESAQVINDSHESDPDDSQPDNSEVQDEESSHE